MRGIFLFIRFLVACYVASVLDLCFQFGFWDTFVFTIFGTLFSSWFGLLFLVSLFGLLASLCRGARHIYQLCFNPESVRAGETMELRESFWNNIFHTVIWGIPVGLTFVPGSESGALTFTMLFLAKPILVWHAILSYFYMVCFWPLLLISIGVFTLEDNAAVRSSDTTQQDAGIHEAVVNSCPREDVELVDELRRLEEQDKITLEETATVTTEDDEDRRYITDALHNAGYHEAVNSCPRDDAESRSEEQDKAILEETAATVTTEQDDRRPTTDKRLTS